MDNSWSLITQDRFQEAYNKATEEYISTGSEIALRHRVTAQLLLKDYQGALKDSLALWETEGSFYENNPHFQDGVANKSDGSYILLGVIYWLLCDYQKAAELWMESMTL